MIAALRTEWSAFARSTVKWSTNEDWRPNLVILSCLFLGTALAGHLIHTDGGPWIPEPWPAVAPGLASAVFIPAVNFWVGRAKRPQNTVAILHVLGTALLQLGVLSLANAARGAFFYSLIFLYVFTAAVHAYRLRVTYRRPFVAIPYAAVIAVAAACAPSEAHLVVYAFLAPLLLGHLLLGQYAANADAAHEREMILRAENSALALELERRQVRRLEEFLEEIAGRTHDIGGPALALDIALEHAMSALAGDAAAAREALAHAKRHTADIRERVRRAKEEVRSVSLPAFEPVDVLEVATAVVEGLRLRFADVDIDVRGERASIELRGGRLALARVIENLGSNGAEAAHTSTSPRLSISWRAEANAIEIAIEDSGPGFEPGAAMMVRGTGVGLLSAGRIIATSGGTLGIDRSQRLGGARCRVRLPAAERPAA